MSRFDCAAFLPESVLDRITELRVSNPTRPLSVARRRHRRSVLAPDGRLNIIAADHPARMVTAVGADPVAMADRHDYLARIARILIGGAADGVMSTMDVLEDLLTLHGLIEEAGGIGFLHDRLLIPSLNRGGLAGSGWELDDPLTGPTPHACSTWGMDGAKLLLRIAADERDTRATLVACAEAVTAANAHNLPVFLEPLPVARGDGGWAVVKEADQLARAVGVAMALGDSSRHLWMKLPYVADYRRVARSTTAPILILGGPAVGDARPLLESVASGLAAGSNVRGTLIGRNVLYPGDDDPLAAAAAMHALVHDRATIDQALAVGDQHRGRGMESLSIVGD